MAQFPTRNSGPHTLPDGTIVHIKTLNSIYKDRADQAGVLAGKRSAAPVRKGGAAYAALVAEMKANSAEEQALYVALGKLRRGQYDSEAEDQFPDLVPPERKKEDTEADFLKRMDKYEKDVAKNLEKRTEKTKALYEATYNDLLQETPRNRVQAALDEAVSDRYYKGYVHAYNCYYIYYAVRMDEDHSEFYFGEDEEKGVRQVEDLDDEVRESILRAYNSIDSVKTREVPTSADS